MNFNQVDAEGLKSLYLNNWLYYINMLMYIHFLRSLNKIINHQQAQRHYLFQLLTFHRLIKYRLIVVIKRAIMPRTEVQ